MKDTQDTLSYLESERSWLGKDQMNPWYVQFGTDQKPMHHRTHQSPYKGKGATAVLSYPIQLEPRQVHILTFYIAGSYTSLRAAKNTYKTLQQKTIQLFKNKKSHYRELARRSLLTTPDEELNKVFTWLKYNAQWFIRTVPEIGTGIAAGYPDYPWWFGCDSAYALQGYLTIGQFDVVKKTIALLDTISKKTNSNGRIVHEISTNGAVYNKGNVNETPQFVSLVWKAYLWTGDFSLLERYFPQIEKGLNWLILEKDSDGDMIPEGAGMMEIHGLESEMIDVICYTQQAFEDAATMADLLNKSKLADNYREIAKTLKEKINHEFWSDAFNAYADFIGTDAAALRLIDDAIIRADTLQKPWAVEELRQTKNYILRHPSNIQRPFVVHHNWVVNTPMETKIAETEKAIRALENARRFTNPFGVFVTGIDRDNSAETDDGSFQGSQQFSYTGAVMTLPTGVMAVAENHYGHPDQALDYLKRMARSFGYALPGSMYEVSPDYGMFAQAWNLYGFGVPIVAQFFGIQPDAHQKKITIQLSMPTSWENASLENVMVGTNEISLLYTKHENEIKLTLQSKESDWEWDVIPPSGYDLNQIVNQDATTQHIFKLKDS